jgi:hypothetical protein
MDGAMSVIEETFHGDDYEIVAWANDEEVLYYNKFGSYQGEWILFTYTQDHHYKLYRGSYGSCSGCDHFEAVFDYVQDKTKQKAKEFAADYEPFVDIPFDTMANIVSAGALKTVFPGNEREWSWGIPMDQVIDLVTTMVKIRENLPIDFKDIFVADAEVSRQARERYGEKLFMKHCRVIEEKAGERLLEVNGHVYVYVQDASTPRQYLLQVPPNMKTIHEAKAWTFDIDPRFYHPDKET